MFQPIRRILPQAVQSHGLGEQITTTRVLQVAQEVCRRLFGEEKAVFFEPLSFAAGQLKIKARGGAAAQELVTREIAFVNEVNRTLGERKVIKMLVV